MARAVAPARTVALGSLAVAVGAAWLALALTAPPEALPTTAAEGEFSAARAMSVVERLANRPRPLGSAAHQESADYLAGELARLGLELSPQRTVAVRATGRQVVAAEVHNVVGRLRGRGDGESADGQVVAGQAADGQAADGQTTHGQVADGQAVLLLAHYDSRPNTPGAGDDAAGVAAILETLRAVVAGPSLRNDLIVLFSDAEEIGLLGARAFADEHEWMADVGVVLNFEARGNRGATQMFETGPGSAGLVRQMAAAAPAPQANSLSSEIYKRMPNDTDFTVFRDRGRAGLNFAFMSHLPAYHSPLDRAAALDPDSLQHHGSYALALARQLGDADLSAPPQADVVYFNPLGTWMVIYRAAWAPFLAVLATVLLLASLEVGRRRQRWTWSAVRGGLGVWIGILVLAPAAVWLSWNLFGRLAAGMMMAPNGVPYASGLLALATSGIVAAVVAALSAADERDDPTAQAGGILMGWAVLALLSAFLMPGASYLFFWPLLAGTAAVAAIVGRPAAPSRAFVVALLGGAALVGVVILTPTIALLFDALTLHAGWVVALFVGLLLSLLAPVIGVAGRGWAAGTAIWIALAAIGLAAGVVWTAEVDDRHPRAENLFYHLDTEESAGAWLSLDEAAGPGAALWLGDRPDHEAAPVFLIPAESGREVWSAPAPVLDLPGPEVSLVDDRWEDGVRRLTVRVASRRQAPVVWLEARALAVIEGLSVDGQAVPLEEPADTVRLIYFGLPAKGFELTFEMADRQPVELHIADQSYGLPPETGTERVFPPGSISGPGWSAWSTFVSRRTWN